jgi:hypothetical protein
MPMLDNCLELSKIKALKMLDLQTKSSMILFQSYLLVQARNLGRKTGRYWYFPDF